MSFTYQKTDFINLKTYNEQTHADALKNGIPNFVNDGLDYDEATNSITSGKGINNGVPFVIGKEGETQTVTTGYTGYLYVETSLQGFNSTSKVLEGTTIPTSTTTKRYFKLWELDNGVAVQDNRHVEYIKNIGIVPVGDTGFKLDINGTLSNTFSTSTLQSGYTKTDAQQNFVWKQDIYDYLTANASGSCFGLILYNVQDQLVSEQIGNRAEYRKEKYALIPSVSGTSTSQETQLRSKIADLTGDVSTSNILIEWKPLVSEALGAVQNLTITYEGNGSHTYHYQTNNYVTTVPTKNSDYIANDTQIFGDIRIGTSSLEGDRDRSFVGYSGLANLNTGNNITLILKKYSLSQVEKLTLVFSNYKVGTTDAIDQNICEVQLTNFISGGANDGYDGFYDTRVISMPFSAYNYSSENYIPSFIKAFNVETTATGGKLLGKSNPVVYSSGGNSYGYCLRTIFVTIANKHWGNPNYATMKNNDSMIKRSNDKALRLQVEQEQELIKNGGVIDVEQWQEEQKQQRLQYEETNKIEIKLSELETAQLRMEEQLQEMETLKEQIEALRKDSNE